MIFIEGRLVLKLQEFLMNSFTADDLPSCAENINGRLRQQRIDGKPVMKTFMIRKGLFKDKIFALVNQQPTARINLALIQLLRKMQLLHGGVLNHSA